MLRGLSDKLNSTNNNTKKADSTFVCSATKRLNCWKESFYGLYNHDPGPTTVPPEIDPHHLPMSDTEPTIKESYEWENTQAGPRRCRGNQNWRGYPHFSTAWTNSTDLENRGDTGEGKGHSRECKNYREISLLSITGKITMKIIQLHLQKHCEQSSNEEQACFRPGRGCCNQIFILRQLIN